jgi:SAM-dependent methyltransferase
MPYIHSLPTSISLTGKGLLGYTFGPLSQKDLEICYIEVEKRRDAFMISNKITRIYYILCGSGHFVIADRKYDVSPGMLVEVPPKVEYCYSGKMKLIAVSKPRWFRGNDIFTKWNPDVIGRDLSYSADSVSWVTRLVGFRIFGRSPIGAYLWFNQRLWNNLPASFTALSPIRSYGNFLHTLARIRGARAQACSTVFLRNRPMLELIRRLLERRVKGDSLRVAVLGCSTGAEVYSVAWWIRSARPDLELVLHAMDISKQAVEVGKCGMYSLAASQLTDGNVFERMTAAEIEQLFDRDGGALTVKAWIKEGIKWNVGDVEESEVLESLGPQDIVVANNFLCHMDASAAERCLRSIARLVVPHGYLFVSGIDLNIRTRIARDLGWKPLQELIEEIHEGDPWLRNDWPFHYAGLEPLSKRRRDWKIRYAAAFQLAPSGQEFHDKTIPIAANVPNIPGRSSSEVPEVT